jgi:hypothetical protein
VKRLTFEFRQGFVEHLANEHGVRFTTVTDTARPSGGAPNHAPEGQGNGTAKAGTQGAESGD